MENINPTTIIGSSSNPTKVLSGNGTWVDVAGLTTNVAIADDIVEPVVGSSYSIQALWDKVVTYINITLKTALNNRLTNKGEWGFTQTYVLNDLVTFNGTVYYRAINTPLTGNESNVFSETDWQLMGVDPTARATADAAQTTATSANNTATNAQTTANAAQTTATSANNTATNAQTTATTAQNTADAALPKAGGAVGNINVTDSITITSANNAAKNVYMSVSVSGGGTKATLNTVGDHFIFKNSANEEIFSAYNYGGGLQAALFYATPAIGDQTQFNAVWSSEYPLFSGTLVPRYKFEAATNNLYTVSSTIQTAVTGGTFTSGELQGTQPVNSVLGQKFVNTTHRFEFMPGYTRSGNVWVRIALVSDIAKYDPTFATYSIGSSITTIATSGKFVNNGNLILTGNTNLTFTGLVSGASGIIVITKDNSNTTYTITQTIFINIGTFKPSATANTVTELSWIYNGSAILWTARYY